MDVIYRCENCGGMNVQLSYPVWLDPNDFDNVDKYEVDFEAQPEKDEGRSWCLDCQNHHFLRRSKV